MTIDHLSFGTHDITATRTFYAEKLGFPMLICDDLWPWIVTQISGNSQPVLACLKMLPGRSTRYGRN